METRGILRPAAVGSVFALERRAPPTDLADLVDDHWLVSWDLRGHEAYRSEVLAHPAVHLVFEPHGAAVFGVPRQRYARTLSGQGWAVGTKFLPGSFARLVERPAWLLTDRVLPLDELFGKAGRRLAAQAAADPEPDVLLAALCAVLRARRPAREDPQATLVADVVADMRAAPPGTRVDEIATRHGVSVRTLQRLFRRHVGVGPKWVLQRYRLHEAIEQLADRHEVDWSRFAADHGYFDQAHFITDFRAVVGCSPARYLAQA